MEWQCGGELWGPRFLGKWAIGHIRGESPGRDSGECQMGDRLWGPPHPAVSYPIDPYSHLVPALALARASTDLHLLYVDGVDEPLLQLFPYHLHGVLQTQCPAGGTRGSVRGLPLTTQDAALLWSQDPGQAQMGVTLSLQPHWRGDDSSGLRINTGPHESHPQDTPSHPSSHGLAGDREGPTGFPSLTACCFPGWALFMPPPQWVVDGTWGCQGRSSVVAGAQLAVPRSPHVTFGDLLVSGLGLCA